MQSSQQHRKAQASHYQPTVGNQACKRKEEKKTLDMDGKFYPIFFFSWLVVVVLEARTENSQKGNQDAGWKK